MGITAFAVNAYSAPTSGEALIEPHDETSPGAGGHEELYLVVTGAAQFVIDGEPVEAPSGTLLAVDPGTLREATAAADATTVLVVGGHPGSALPPSPFEYWYSALPAERAGRLEDAYTIVSEGLEQWPDHGTIHYVMGALSAQMGRRDEALRHLRAAFDNDPRTREWAEDDSDLDSIRDDPAFPS